jgi:hypothetical protein
MTTVGYGDMTPLTVQGKIVGAIAAMIGAFVVGMPVAIISNNFADHMNELEKKKFLNKELKKYEENVNLE